MTLSMLISTAAGAPHAHAQGLTTTTYTTDGNVHDAHNSRQDTNTDGQPTWWPVFSDEQQPATANRPRPNDHDTNPAPLEHNGETGETRQESMPPIPPASGMETATGSNAGGTETAEEAAEEAANALENSAQTAAHRNLIAVAETVAADLAEAVDIDLLVAGWEQTSPQRRTAVLSALAELGDPYIRWAVGPNGFDCSGLTMHAWQQAGLTLPHHAASQQRRTKRVHQNELDIGDLVFSRQNGVTGHVKMYIGAGLVIHASGNNGAGVVIGTLNPGGRNERYGHVQTP